MAFKHMKRCGTSTIKLEMQIKTMRCHFKFIILAKPKNTFKLGLSFGRNAWEGNWQTISRLKIFIS